MGDKKLIDDLKIPKDVLRRGILVSRGYVVNKWVVWAGFVPALLIVSVLFLQYGWGDHWSVSCPESRVKCFNNFYVGCNPLNPFENCAVPELRDRVCADDPYLCTLKYLPGGFEAGSRPGAFFEWGELLVLLFPFVGVLINHFKYNKNWRRKT